MLKTNSSDLVSHGSRKLNSYSWGHTVSLLTGFPTTASLLFPSLDHLPSFFSLSLDLPRSSSGPPLPRAVAPCLAFPRGLGQSLVAQSLAVLSRSYSSLPFDVLHPCSGLLMGTSPGQ